MLRHIQNCPLTSARYLIAGSAEFVIGEPLATLTMSAEQLKKNGFVGLYLKK